MLNSDNKNKKLNIKKNIIKLIFIHENTKKTNKSPNLTTKMKYKTKSTTLICGISVVNTPLIPHIRQFRNKNVALKRYFFTKVNGCNMLANYQ